MSEELTCVLDSFVGPREKAAMPLAGHWQTQDHRGSARGGKSLGQRNISRDDIAPSGGLLRWSVQPMKFVVSHETYDHMAEKKEN
jgi:hypothetical protein